MRQEDGRVRDKCRGVDLDGLADVDGSVPPVAAACLLGGDDFHYKTYTQ